PQLTAHPGDHAEALAIFGDRLAYHADAAAAQAGTAAGWGACSCSMWTCDSFYSQEMESPSNPGQVSLRSDPAKWPLACSTPSRYCRAAGFEPRIDEQATGNTVWRNLAQGRGVTLINASVMELAPRSVVFVNPRTSGRDVDLRGCVA